MRILLATTSGTGHFLPMVPFAAALREAGHEIRVAAPKSLGDLIERSGFQYCVCEDIAPADFAIVQDEIRQAPEQARVLFVTRILADLAARAILPGMLKAIDEWRPEVILREVAELGSFIAAELRSVRQVTVLTIRHELVEKMVSLAVPGVAQLRASVGLPPDVDGQRLRAVPALSLLPASLDEPPARQQPAPSATGGSSGASPNGGEPGAGGSSGASANGGESAAGGSIVVHRYREVVRENGSAELPTWGSNAGDPLVYVTLGTVFTKSAAGSAVLRALVDALRDLPVRVLVTLGGHGDVGAWEGVAANVRVQRWVAERDVLREAAAVVFHGGLGTLLSAVTAGVPSVVVPQFGDQPDNAAIAEAVGVGVRVGMDQDGAVDAGAVRTAVLRVLTEPSFRRRARQVAEEIAALPPAGAAVELITGLAR